MDNREMKHIKNRIAFAFINLGFKLLRDDLQNEIFVRNAIKVGYIKLKSNKNE